MDSKATSLAKTEKMETKFTPQPPSSRRASVSSTDSKSTGKKHTTKTKEFPLKREEQRLRTLAESLKEKERLIGLHEAALRKRELHVLLMEDTLRGGNPLRLPPRVHAAAASHDAAGSGGFWTSRTPALHSGPLPATRAVGDRQLSSSFVSHSKVSAAEFRGLGSAGSSLGSEVGGAAGLGAGAGAGARGPALAPLGSSGETSGLELALEGSSRPETAPLEDAAEGALRQGSSAEVAVAAYVHEAAKADQYNLRYEPFRRLKRDLANLQGQHSALLERCSKTEHQRAFAHARRKESDEENEALRRRMRESFLEQRRLATVLKEVVGERNTLKEVVQTLKARLGSTETELEELKAYIQQVDRTTWEDMVAAQSSAERLRQEVNVVQTQLRMEREEMKNALALAGEAEVFKQAAEAEQAETLRLTKALSHKAKELSEATAEMDTLQQHLDALQVMVSRLTANKDKKTKDNFSGDLQQTYRHIESLMNELAYARARCDKFQGLMSAQVAAHLEAREHLHTAVKDKHAEMEETRTECLKLSSANEEAQLEVSFFRNRNLYLRQELNHIASTAKKAPAAPPTGGPSALQPRLSFSPSTPPGARDPAVSPPAVSLRHVVPPPGGGEEAEGGGPHSARELSAGDSSDFILVSPASANLHARYVNIGIDGRKHPQADSKVTGYPKVGLMTPAEGSLVAETVRRGADDHFTEDPSAPPSATQQTA